MNISEHKLFQIILLPVSFIYGLIIRIRNFCHDNGLFSTIKIDGCKIISIGNISVGGAGKTPVVKFLADYLKKRGLKVAILSRGYGRKSKGTVIVSDGNKILANMGDSGDEPLMLANQLKTIPVIVEADRIAGAQFILKRFAPDVILLDDGFQHRRIFRDLNIVLVDASFGFAKKYLLPSGFLREPVSSLKRANLIWFTRVNFAPDLEQLQKMIDTITSCPQVKSVHRPTKLIQVNTKREFDLSFLKGKKVLLFSGIANHASFKKTVKNLAATVVFDKEFGDHFFYSRKDIKNIFAHYKSAGAELILTTEKDYYRLVNLCLDFNELYYLTIEISIKNDYDIFVNKMAAIL